MRFLQWILGLLGLEPSSGDSRSSLPARPASRGFAPSPAPHTRRREDAPHPQAPLGRAAPAKTGKAHRPRFGRSRVGNLDFIERASDRLENTEQSILARIDGRIESGNFELPQLPSESLGAIEMTNRPSADVKELVKLISHDPILSSELLKTANSVLYATHHPAETLHDAVMRIGLREMRALIFSVSMRGVILKGRGLSEYAEEVWRQAQSVAVISRAIAPVLGRDADKDYLLGLLHDVGKISLLALLRMEVRNSSDVTSSLVGRVFHTFHEKAGRAMALKWRLPEEIVSVAGCHHDYFENEEHSQAAAAAHLAHRLDLFLSLDDDEDFNEMMRSPVMDFLGVTTDDRHRILGLARKAHAAPDDAEQESSSLPGAA